VDSLNLCRERKIKVVMHLWDGQVGDAG
jgi:hypothetical protein